MGQQPELVAEHPDKIRGSLRGDRVDADEAVSGLTELEVGSRAVGSENRASKRDPGADRETGTAGLCS